MAKLPSTSEAKKHLRHVSFWQKIAMVVFGQKVYLSHEQPQGFIAPTPFYLFWCRACNHFVKDYPHGWYQVRCTVCKTPSRFWGRPKELSPEAIPEIQER